MVPTMFRNTASPTSPGPAILALLVLLASCSVAPGASDAPSASAPASAAASPSALLSIEPSPTFEPTVVLPPLSHARSGAQLDLIEYSVVGTDYDATFHSVGTLPSGQDVIVLGGPRERDGLTWYQIELGSSTQHAGDYWVAVADAASLTNSDSALTCPANADTVLTMVGWDRLRCFGDQPMPVVITGLVSHCQGGVTSVEPVWLGYACWVVEDSAGETMELHASPTGGITLPDELVSARMTGHFDDPAASECRSAGDATHPYFYPGVDEQILLCREAFVVDSLEILP